MKNKKKNPMLARRNFLQGAGAAAAAMSIPSSAMAMRRLSAARQVPEVPGGPVSVSPHTLLYINLRGGADGLSFIEPTPDIGAPRPTLRLTSPIDVTGIAMPSTYWKANQALGNLINGTPTGSSAWADGNLAFVPAAGLHTRNRSHFVAQDWIEYGVPFGKTVETSPLAGGFLSRHLGNSALSATPALRGLILQQIATASFFQAPQSLAINDVTDFDFPEGIAAAAATEALHDRPDVLSPLRSASNNTFASIDYFKNEVDFTAPNPSHYPSTRFGTQMLNAAAMVMSSDPNNASSMAPEVIEIDLGGWDTHGTQGPNLNGGMYELILELSNSLAAFYDDVKDAGKLGAVSVVVVTEFGRRIMENNSLGTDHGYGSCMMVMGGGVNGGLVYDQEWSAAGGTLASVTNDGDVDVLVDHRDVFTECFTKRLGLGSSAVSAVYGGSYSLDDRNIFS